MTLLAWEMSATLWWLVHSLVLPFLGIGMKIDLFQLCSHFWVFQICWPIECNTLMWESIPRQVDKRSRIPKAQEQEEKKNGGWGSWGDRSLEFLRRKKGQTSFIFFFLSLSHIRRFSLGSEQMIAQQTTQFKLCTKDYIATMYPAWGQFLNPENLLANPVILKCKLWEWVY